MNKPTITFSTFKFKNLVKVQINDQFISIHMRPVSENVLVQYGEEKGTLKIDSGNVDRAWTLLNILHDNPRHTESLEALQKLMTIIMSKVDKHQERSLTKRIDISGAFTGKKAAAA